jgi:[ribosomal protein S5]-alanine N-acetyltransferase
MQYDEPSLIILTTERLLLRRQTSADAEFLVALWSDPEVTRHLGGPRDQEWLRATFEESAVDPFREEFDLWPVVERASGQPIGHCGLLPKEVDGLPEIELNYIFARSAWGRGYAVEIGTALLRHAFKNLGLQRLIALIDPENEASERVAARLGMRLERSTTRPSGAGRRVYAIEAGARP